MELIRKVRVRVEGGLHARPAAEVVRLAKGFSAEITLATEAQKAVARSSLKLLMLGVKEGDEVEISASGDDAPAALEALARYLSDGQDAAAAATPAASVALADAPSPTPQGVSNAAGGGLGVSPGRAIGPVFVLRQPEITPEPAQISPQAVPAERARALKAQAEVAERCRQEANGADPATAAVLAALAEIAGDSEWSEQISQKIQAGAGALAAIRDSGADLAAAIAALEDPYASARAEDMRGATELVALALQGKKPLSPADAPEGSVIVAQELSAVHLGHSDLSRLAGVVTARGARTGHAAILLRAAGVPAVFGLGEGLAAVTGAALVALDGSTGEVVADPDQDSQARWQQAIRNEAAETEALEAYRHIAPVSRDGVAVTVAANIGSVKDAEKAALAGAMGVGLFRTEFLFLDRPDLPDEQEQLAAYSRVLALFPDHDVIIRTLDIGGDKPARSIAVAAEDNPFLGLRGIRLCLAHPAIFRTQLRALLRAAPKGRLLVMLPMVADLAEIRATRALIDQARAELVAEGLEHGSFALGIMVETPAAVFQASALAQEADFFSIGTNDLTQYVMAADRLNPAVAGLCVTTNPAVLAAIAQVAAAATAQGKLIGVCGEAAGDPALIPFLLKAGVRELSMVSAAIPRAKRLISEIDLTSSEESTDV